ncbi:hypothetical protein [Salsuginibacillus kocurii]|uniref:hypothetical protein n=1 Tax=Salsuginibacillus kocurii TaxID=427078 RepID=UPI00036BDFE1|nr:hypothetical protein [Salsuginibacillus kocurii]
MANASKGLAFGLILTILLAIIAIILESSAFFVLTSAGLGALALIPLAIAIFKTPEMPKPTIYGTSRPGEFTTVPREEKDSPLKTQQFQRAFLFVWSAIVLFIAFFAAGLYFM